MILSVYKYIYIHIHIILFYIYSIIEGTDRPSPTKHDDTAIELGVEAHFPTRELGIFRAFFFVFFGETRSDVSCILSIFFLFLHWLVQATQGHSNVSYSHFHVLRSEFTQAIPHISLQRGSNRNAIITESWVL